MRYVHEKLERIWLPGSQVVQFGVSCFQPFSINLSTYDVFISLDDKFWHLQGASSPFACVKGIFRFKTSTKVTEFWDLRANPRRLFEGQIFFFRVKWSSTWEKNLKGSIFWFPRYRPFDTRHFPLPMRQPIIVSKHQIVSPSLYALSFIDHSNL